MLGWQDVKRRSAWHEGRIWGAPEICVLWLELACGQKGFWAVRLKRVFEWLCSILCKGYVKVSLFLSNMCLDSKFVVVAEMFPSWPHKNIPSPLKHRAPVEKFAALELQGALEHPCKWKNRGKNSAWFSREVLGSTWGTIRFTRGTSFAIAHILCECIPPFPEKRAALSINPELQQNPISPLYPAPSIAGRAGSPSSPPPLVCIGKEMQSTSQGGIIPRCHPWHR